MSDSYSLFVCCASMPGKTKKALLQAFEAGVRSALVAWFKWWGDGFASRDGSKCFIRLLCLHRNDAVIGLQRTDASVSTAVAIWGRTSRMSAGL